MQIIWRVFHQTLHTFYKCCARLRDAARQGQANAQEDAFLKIFYGADYRVEYAVTAPPPHAEAFGAEEEGLGEQAEEEETPPEQDGYYSVRYRAQRAPLEHVHNGNPGSSSSSSGFGPSGFATAAAAAPHMGGSAFTHASSVLAQHPSGGVGVARGGLLGQPRPGQPGGRAQLGGRKLLGGGGGGSLLGRGAGGAPGAGGSTTAFKRPRPIG